jgi:hypothetical protein
MGAPLDGSETAIPRQGWRFALLNRRRRRRSFSLQLAITFDGLDRAIANLRTIREFQT